jgi:5-methylcytosine-specific restriction endonuclease McrA
MGRRLPNEAKYKTINGVKHKRCSTCGKFVPEDQFSTRKASPDGLAYSCKTCERATAAKSYERKQQKAKARDRYQANKEDYIERAKARYQENKEDIAAKQKEWRQSKKGKKLVNKASAVRRQRIIDQTPGGRDYVAAEIIERDSVDGVCICQICGEPINIEAGDLQIDHIVGIAAGGSDTKDNVRCAHKLCNIKRPKDCRDL